MTPIHQLRLWLEEQIRVGDLSVGVQLVARVGEDTIIDWALGEDGVGRPLRRDSIFMVRCAVAKPLMALGVAVLVDEGRLQWDTPIGTVLGAVRPEVGAITVMQLLDHTAGLHATPGAELSLYRPDERRLIVAQRPPPDGWRVGVDCEFAEAAGGTLLAMVVEAISDRPYHDHLRSSVVEPLGLDLVLGGDGDFATFIEQVAVNCWLDGEHKVALLMERTEFAIREWNPAYGGYASAAGLVDLYRATLDRPPLLRPATWSVLTCGTGRYGAGFAIDLSDFYVVTPTPAGTFGHGGNGVSLALAVPSLDLALAVNFVGQLAAKSAAVVRFSRTVELVIDAVSSAQP